MVNTCGTLFDQTPEIRLPIDFVQKNMDEEEDIVSLTLNRMRQRGQNSPKESIAIENFLVDKVQRYLSD